MTEQTRGRIELLAEERLTILSEIPESVSGLDCCRRHTRLCDEVVETLYEDLVAGQPGASAIAIIATGGYGRRELAPYSDIDVTVVPSHESAEATDSAIRQLFQDLHWAFGTQMRLDVGYAYRLVADTPGLDEKTRTGLLDARLLAGSADLFQSLIAALWHNFAAGEFVLAKVRERYDAFHRYHDTALVVEPHLKEGAGGLRCFQAANWLRAAIGERPIQPTPAYDRIARLRNLLHFTSQKRNDLLSRQRQAEIADLTHADLFAMMSKATEDGLSLQKEFEQSEQSLHESRFQLAEGVIALRGEARIVGRPDPGEAAVGIAIATQLGMRVEDIPSVAGHGIAGPSAAYAISSGEMTLRNLDRCGLLEALLPELTACRTLMPRDPVHIYTVFEHTLRMVRLLDTIPPQGFLGDLKSSVPNIEPLYLAAVLHDVGKVKDDLPHSETGAEMARSVCQRWDLASDFSSTVEWLVRDHLVMARFIALRDLSNPQTIDEFAALVKTEDRLNLLTILTWADVNAVQQGAWTAAQDAQLRELHARTAERLHSAREELPDPAEYRRRLVRQLKQQDTPEADIQSFVGSLPAHYMTSTAPETVKLHLELAQRAGAGQATVELLHKGEINVSELTVCAPDAPGLLSRMLGVLYALGLSIHSIRAATTRAASPVALDVFTISHGGRPVPAATAKQLAATMLSVLKGSEGVEEVLKQHGKDPERKQQVFRYIFVPGHPAVLEIQAPRGTGMAYRFSRLIAEQGWNIQSARVGQWAGQGAAAFYITGPEDTTIEKSAIESALGVRL